MTDKTHFKKAFNSPYLSSADIVGQTVLTIKYVKLEPDKSKRTKDSFNTAYFAEKEIRPGETLKPFILNVGNSKTMKILTGSPFLEDWTDVKVTIYVDPNVKFGREIMEGLRISPDAPVALPQLMRDTQAWTNAIAAYQRDGNLEAVTSRATVTPEDAALLKQEAGL